MRPSIRWSALLVGFLLFGEALALDLGLPEKYRLRNGLRVVTLRDASLPLVGVALLVPAGSSGETAETHGYGHLLADLWQHLEFSPESSALRARLDDHGIHTRTEFDESMVAGFVTLPAEEWKLGFQLARTWLDTTRFSPESLDAARTRVLRELSKKARFPRQQGVLADRLQALAYPGHPLGLTPDGDEGAVRQVTVEKLAEHVAGRLLPNGAVLALVGDLPEVDPLLDECMERFQSPAGSSHPGVSQPPEPQGAEHREVAQLEKTAAAVGFRVPGLEHEDFPAILLIHHMLSKGPNSLLHRRLVQHHGLLSSVRGSISMRPGDNLLSVELESVDASIDRALRGVLRACVGLARRPRRPEELENVRQGMKAHRALRTQLRVSQARRLARAELFGKSHLLLELPEHLDRVTPEDVVRVASRYLRPDRAQVVVLHPRGAVEEKAGKVHWNRFGGGVEVVFQGDASSEVVGLAVAFPGGIGVEPADRPGLSAMLEAYLTRCGTSQEAKSLTKERLQRHGTQVHALSGGTWGSAVGLTATVYGFEDLLGSLVQTVLHPRWDEEIFRRVQEEALGHWRDAARRPQTSGNWRLFEKLYSREGVVPRAATVAEKLPTYTLDDLRNLHEALLDDPRWVVGVSGNLSSSRVMAAVGRAFGVQPTGPGQKGRARPPSDWRRAPGIDLAVETTEDEYDAIWVGMQLPGTAVTELLPLTVWFNLLVMRDDSLVKRELRAVDPSFEATWHSMAIPSQGGTLSFGCRLGKGKGREAAKRIQKALEGLQDHVVDQALLDETSRKIRMALLQKSQQRLVHAATLASNTQTADWPTVHDDLVEGYAGLGVERVRESARTLLRSGVVLLFEAR